MVPISCYDDVGTQVIKKKKKTFPKRDLNTRPLNQETIMPAIVPENPSATGYIKQQQIQNRVHEFVS